MNPTNQKCGGEEHEPNYERQGLVLGEHTNRLETTDSGSDKRNAQEQSKVREWAYKAIKPVGLFTFALVLIAIFQAKYTRDQLENMDGQLDVMRKQLRQMESDDKRGDRMVAANEGVKDSMAQAVKNYASAASDALTEQRKALSATLAQGKAALDASILTSKIEQRPYVWAKSMVITNMPAIAGDGPVIVELAYQTGGKTPSINIDIRYECLLGNKVTNAMESPIIRREIAPEKGRKPMTVTLMPGSGASYRLVCGVPTEYEMKVPFVAVQGYISYEDIRGEPHRTNYCFLVRNVKDGEGGFCGHELR